MFLAPIRVRTNRSHKYEHPPSRGADLNRIAGIKTTATWLVSTGCIKGLRLAGQTLHEKTKRYLPINVDRSISFDLKPRYSASQTACQGFMQATAAA